MEKESKNNMYSLKQVQQTFLGSISVLKDVKFHFSNLLTKKIDYFWETLILPDIFI